MPCRVGQVRASERRPTRIKRCIRLVELGQVRFSERRPTRNKRYTLAQQRVTVANGGIATAALGVPRGFPGPCFFE
jgi:hypothetical protein